jgi:hypothetical protein
MNHVAPSMPASIAPQLATPAARQSRRTRFFEQTSLILPLAGIGVGAWLASRDEARARTLGLAALGCSFAAALARWQLARLVTEKARYRVEVSDGDFEIRHYASLVRAETVVNAAVWERSLEEGFHRLAGYISGSNAAAQKIAMTAPVTATVGASDRATRTVAFKMPDRYPLESLPQPSDPQITLRRVSARRVAALTFRGRYGGDLPAQKRQELLLRVRRAGLLPIGEVTFGGYDAPWTLPLARRNEVWVEVSSLPRSEMVSSLTHST